MLLRNLNLVFRIFVGNCLAAFEIYVTKNVTIVEARKILFKLGALVNEKNFFGLGSSV